MDGKHGEGHRSEGGKAGLLRQAAPAAISRRALGQALAGLPELAGDPIRLECLPALTVSGGRLHSGRSLGREVHAASFLIERRIVLDAALRRNPLELRRILIHELFHFVWRRMGNQRRRQWETILDGEMQQRARGELGWSADVRKEALSAGDRAARSRKWREYIAESFCDSAAYYYLGASHEEHTLSRRNRERRGAWFERFLTQSPLPV